MALASESQLKIYHDRISAVLYSSSLDSRTALILTAQLDVLCYVLGHENNERFQKMMMNLEEALLQAGIQEEAQW